MANVISVKDYVASYRPAYEGIKAEGTRKRGERAYENLFGVADRTDDMQEAQLIIEKEGLMLKLTTEDALDIHEATLAKMDPLDEVTTVLTNLNIDLYREAQSTEDITYRSGFLELQTIELTGRGKIKMILAAHLAELLIKYDSAKRLLRAWPDDGKAKGALSAMAKYRQAIRGLMAMIETELNLQSENIFEDQFFMIQTLSPQNLDAYGRTKRTMHPDSILAYKDMLAEIMSDLSLNEILMHEQPHGMCYRPHSEVHQPKSKVQETAAGAAQSIRKKFSFPFKF